MPAGVSRWGQAHIRQVRDDDVARPGTLQRGDPGDQIACRGRSAGRVDQPALENVVAAAVDVKQRRGADARHIDQIAIAAAQRDALTFDHRAVLLGDRGQDFIGAVTAHRIVAAVRIAGERLRHHGCRGQGLQPQRAGQPLGGDLRIGLAPTIDIHGTDAVGEADPVRGQAVLQRAVQIGELPAVAQRVAEDDQLRVRRGGGECGKAGEQQRDAQGVASKSHKETPVIFACKSILRGL